MRADTILALVIAMPLSFTMAVWAQQPGPTPSPAPVAGTAAAVTLDCPPAAGASAGMPGSSPTPSGSAVGTPQGAGRGSGLAAMPSSGPARRVEGTIEKIDSTRTNRIIEVGAVTLEVEPSTVILVECQRGSTADLKEGARIKAAYEVRNNRNMATVIETK
jgi:hypothetical protein